MKSIVFAYMALFAGVFLADIPQLIEFLNKYDFGYLNEKMYTLPVFFGLAMLSVKGIYDITQYTDETIPLMMGIFSLILAVFGLLVYFRFLTLGSIILVAAAYWNRRIVNSYYPRKFTR